MIKLLFSLLIFVSLAAGRNVTLLKENGEYSFTEGLQSANNSVAWGIFTDEFNSTGWYYLEIKTFSNFTDGEQVFRQKFRCLSNCLVEE